MADPKFPHIHVKLTGEDGNSFAILGKVAAAMRDAGIDQGEIDDYLKRAMAGDYDHLLKVSMETVDISFS